MTFSNTLKQFALSLTVCGALTAATPVCAAETEMNADLVNESQFAMVAAPIPGTGRSQLQIYEQVGSQRACFTQTGNTVEPLLVTFDFTNICQRYIDSNNYSLRIGRQDLATVYRLTIRKEGGEHMLVAMPTREGAGPEVIVARGRGNGDAFLRLSLDHGWSLRHRSWQGTGLNHLYLYRDNWPVAEGSSLAVQPSAAPSQSTAQVVAPAVASVSPVSATAPSLASNATPAAVQTSPAPVPLF